MIVNLTPHTINIHTGGGPVVSIQPSGLIARVETKEMEDGEVEGIPVVRSRFGSPIGIPSPEPGVFFIVSRILLDACRGRNDLLAPGPLIRDSEGRPVGCRGLSR